MSAHTHSLSTQRFSGAYSFHFFWGGFLFSTGILYQYLCCITFFDTLASVNNLYVWALQSTNVQTCVYYSRTKYSVRFYVVFVFLSFLNPIYQSRNILLLLLLLLLLCCLFKAMTNHRGEFCISFFLLLQVTIYYSLIVWGNYKNGFFVNKKNQAGKYKQK